LGAFPVARIDPLVALRQFRAVKEMTAVVFISTWRGIASIISPQPSSSMKNIPNLMLTLLALVSHRPRNSRRARRQSYGRRMAKCRHQPEFFRHHGHADEKDAQRENLDVRKIFFANAIPARKWT